MNFFKKKIFIIFGFILLFGTLSYFVGIKIYQLYKYAQHNKLCKEFETKTKTLEKALESGNNELAKELLINLSEKQFVAWSILVWNKHANSNLSNKLTAFLHNTVYIERLIKLSDNAFFKLMCSSFGTIIITSKKEEFLSCKCWYKIMQLPKEKRSFILKKIFQNLEYCGDKIKEK